MTDDTDTIRVPDVLLAQMPAQPTEDTKPAKPDNVFLVIGTALLAGAIIALAFWIADPKMSHAQSALISCVVMVVGAATAIVCHLVRVWICAAEERTAKRIEGVAKRSRCMFYDMSSDLGRVSAEQEALLALLGDFIKRYPPVEGFDAAAVAELRAQVETLAEMVANGSTVTLDVANNDVYELGKSVGRDEMMRKFGQDPRS